MWCSLESKSHGPIASHGLHDLPTLPQTLPSQSSISVRLAILGFNCNSEMLGWRQQKCHTACPRIIRDTNLVGGEEEWSLAGSERIEHQTCSDTSLIWQTGTGDIAPTRHTCTHPLLPINHTGLSSHTHLTWDSWKKQNKTEQKQKTVNICLNLEII